MKFLITALFTFSITLFAGEVGNEVVGEDGRPLSISNPVCKSKFNGLNYLNVVDPQKVPIKDVLNFVKEIYSPLYEQLMTRLETINFCETTQNITPQLYPHEFKASRVSLWISEGDVNFDLIILDTRKFYGPGPSNSDRAFILLKEMFYSVITRYPFYYSGRVRNNMEWVSSNLVNLLSQAYLKKLNSTFTASDKLNIHSQLIGYGMFHGAQRPYDSINIDHMSDICFENLNRNLEKCKDLKNSLTYGSDSSLFKNKFNELYSKRLDETKFLTSLDIKSLDFVLEILNEDQISLLSSPSFNFLFSIRDSTSLIDIINVLQKHGKFEQFKSSIGSQLANSQLGLRMWSVSDYLKSLEITDQYGIHVFPDKERLLAKLVVLRDSKNYKITSPEALIGYVNSELVPNLNALQKLGFSAEEIATAFIYNNIFYININTQFDPNFFRSVKDIIFHYPDWSSIVLSRDDINYYIKHNVRAPALIWGVLIEEGIVTKEKLSRESRSRLIRYLRNFEETRQYSNLLK